MGENAWCGPNWINRSLPDYCRPTATANRICSGQALLIYKGVDRVRTQDKTAIILGMESNDTANRLDKKATRLDLRWDGGTSQTKVESDLTRQMETIWKEKEQSRDGVHLAAVTLETHFPNLPFPAILTECYHFAPNLCRLRALYSVLFVLRDKVLSSAFGFSFSIYNSYILFCPFMFF